MSVRLLFTSAYLLTGQLLEHSDIKKELAGVGRDLVQGGLCPLCRHTLLHQGILIEKRKKTVRRPQEGDNKNLNMSNI